MRVLADAMHAAGGGGGGSAALQAAGGGAFRVTVSEAVGYQVTRCSKYYDSITSLTMTLLTMATRRTTTRCSTYYSTTDCDPTYYGHQAHHDSLLYLL